MPQMIVTDPEPSLTADQVKEIRGRGRVGKRKTGWHWSSKYRGRRFIQRWLSASRLINPVVWRSSPQPRKQAGRRHAFDGAGSKVYPFRA